MENAPPKSHSEVFSLKELKNHRMGLQKWLLKNGPGSPGSTAKFFSNYYQRLASSQPDATWEDIFIIMYYDRIKTTQALDPQNKAGGRLTTQFPETITGFSEGDICIFTFMVLYLETDKFKIGIEESIHSGTREFELCLEVIHEVAQSLLPHMIKFNKKDFKMKAHHFMADF